MNIKDKKDILLPKLYDFYKIDTNMKVMLPIIMGDSIISIRVLDWFVTNYSKKKNIYYKINDKIFNIHNDYKAQLKGYKKNYFDPFCRKKRIPFFYNDDNYIITTIGQLNFFRWAISKKIISYVYDYFDIIYKDMQSKDLIEMDNITNDEQLINNISSGSESVGSIKKLNKNYKEYIEINFDI
jgi:hypothetical protein